MADVLLNPDADGAGVRTSNVFEVGASTIRNFDFRRAGVVVRSRYVTAGGPGASSGTAAPTKLRLKTNLANAYSIAGISFKFNGVRHIGKVNGDVQVSPSTITGIGTKVGELTLGSGELVLSSWDIGPTYNPVVTDFSGVASAPVNSPNSPFNSYAVVGRTAAAPLRTGSFSLLGTMLDETTFNVVADSDGFIDEPSVKGKINYTTGVFVLVFTSPTAVAGADPIDITSLGIPGISNVFINLVKQETLRYNAVAYTYLPMDADLLGIDPVRLPSDGRVPIFRPGSFGVIGNKQTTASTAVSNGSVIDTGRSRLSRVRVLGANNATIYLGYTQDLEAGTVTFTDVAGYSQPVRVEHRIEDMGVIRDAEIDGTLTFTRPVTHAYPIAGSFISSALMAGDIHARVSATWDQASWDGISFLSGISGAAATATYNDTVYPIVVDNAGAVTQRWALKFITTQTFQVIGERTGIIATGSINTITAPINPATGEPYFTIPVEGWGSGWAVGNVLFVHTVGGLFPVWMIRTVQQGPEAGHDYSFTTLVRGDVDAT